MAVSDCREAATFVPSLDKVSHKQYHHMREGNLPRDSKCIVCKKNCHSMECFTGMRCGWCNITVSFFKTIHIFKTINIQLVMLLEFNFFKAHAICYRQVKKDCDFAQLRKIMLPPNSVTIPRTELPMEQLLNIHCAGGTNQSEGNRKGFSIYCIYFFFIF